MISKQITFRESADPSKSELLSTKRKQEIKASSIFTKNSSMSPTEAAKKKLQIEMLTKKRKLALQQSPVTPKKTGSLSFSSLSKTL
jgi:hypothetical protein